mmetsp:Transcript_62872/g.159158  ORF Transcript_62872/g.159158 Transcript_62872/m.159158 type:complete len:275 (+) Transcript_62872:250-1074(+)
MPLCLVSADGHRLLRGLRLQCLQGCDCLICLGPHHGRLRHTLGFCCLRSPDKQLGLLLCLGDLRLAGAGSCRRCCSRRRCSRHRCCNWRGGNGCSSHRGGWGNSTILQRLQRCNRLVRTGLCRCRLWHALLHRGLIGPREQLGLLLCRGDFRLARAAHCCRFARTATGAATPGGACGRSSASGAHGGSRTARGAGRPRGAAYPGLLLLMRHRAGGTEAACRGGLQVPRKLTCHALQALGSANGAVADKRQGRHLDLRCRPGACLPANRPGCPLA